MDLLESKVQNRYIKYLNRREQIDIQDIAKRISVFLYRLNAKQRETLFNLLTQIHQIQLSEKNIFKKSKKIKNILQNKQSIKNKLLTGKLSAIIAGGLTFGTGRIEDIGLGSAYDVWGFLANKCGEEVITNTITKFNTNIK